MMSVSLIPPRHGPRRRPREHCQRYLGENSLKNDYHDSCVKNEFHFNSGQFANFKRRNPPQSTQSGAPVARSGVQAKPGLPSDCWGSRPDTPRPDFQPNIGKNGKQPRKKCKIWPAAQVLFVKKKWKKKKHQMRRKKKCGKYVFHRWRYNQEFRQIARCSIAVRKT